MPPAGSEPQQGKFRGAGEFVDTDPKSLAEARKQGKLVRTPPLYWAAFVLSGDWR